MRNKVNAAGQTETSRLTGRGSVNFNFQRDEGAEANMRIFRISAPQYVVRLFLGFAVFASIVLVTVTKLPARSASLSDPSVILVVDTSGSMSDPVGLGNSNRKIDEAKSALSTLVNGLSGAINVGIRSFDGDCSDGGILRVPVAGFDKPRLLQAVGQLTPGGGTPIPQALRAAIGDLPASSTKRSVVLISDGQSSCGDPCPALKAVLDSGVSVTVNTIGFAIAGTAAEPPMQCMAQISGGSYYPVASAGSLATALQQLITAPVPVIVNVPTPKFDLPPLVVPDDAKKNPFANVLMASLGDSYQSGEGLLPGRGTTYDCATDTPKGTYFINSNVIPPSPSNRKFNLFGACDTENQSLTDGTKIFENVRNRGTAEYENKCHRHGEATGPLAAQTFGVQPGNFLFTACSGAKIEDLISRRQYPMSPFAVHGGEPQLDRLLEWSKARKASPQLITVGVGGNDLDDGGLGGIIANCIQHNCVALKGTVSGAERTGSYVVDRVNDRLKNSLPRALKSLLSELKSKFPSSTIALIGYPNVFSSEASCWGSVGLDADERKWAAEYLIPELNDTLKYQAAINGVHFVGIADLTVGKEVCQKDAYLNGLRLGDDILGIVGNESFHPNQDGHALFAKRLLEVVTSGSTVVPNPLPGNPPAVQHREWDPPCIDANRVGFIPIGPGCSARMGEIA